MPRTNQHISPSIKIDYLLDQSNQLKSTKGAKFENYNNLHIENDKFKVRENLVGCHKGEKACKIFCITS